MKKVSIFRKPIAEIVEFSNVDDIITESIGSLGEDEPEEKPTNS